MTPEDAQVFYEIKRLKEQIANITNRWNIEEWTEVRTPDYLFSDYLFGVQALRYKYLRIQHYENKGFPMPYNAEALEKMIEEKEKEINKVRSVLDPFKKLDL